MSLNLAVLVSGSGSNLQSIIDACESGKLDATIKVVLSNKADAYGLERARKHGIPNFAVSHKDFDSREAFDREMVRIMREHGVDTLAMAGFMRIVTTELLNAFPGRVINIHPSLLPSFAGVRGQDDAAAYGVRFSGCTVHFVDEKMDHGPVIVQAVVPAFNDDDGSTLGKRILELEHRIFPQALQWLAEDRLSVEDRKVLVKGCETGCTSTDGFMVCPPLDETFL